MVFLWAGPARWTRSRRAPWSRHPLGSGEKDLESVPYWNQTVSQVWAPESWDPNPELLWLSCSESTWRHSELSSCQDVLPGKWCLAWRDGGRGSGRSLPLCALQSAPGGDGLSRTLFGAKQNASAGNADTLVNAKALSWLHALLPRGRGCHSWHKDTHFWCQHHKLAFTQHSRWAAVPCLVAMKLRAEMMRNRSVCWQLLSSEDINAGQSSKLPVRGQISD